MALTVDLKNPKSEKAKDVNMWAEVEKEKAGSQVKSSQAASDPKHDDP